MVITELIQKLRDLKYDVPVKVELPGYDLYEIFDVRLVEHREWADGPLVPEYVEVVYK